MQPIYVVTMLRIQDDRIRETRRIAYYRSELVARFCVETNDCDCFEHFTFSHAVIEQISPGMYPRVEKEIWYEFTNVRDKPDTPIIVEVPKPAAVHNTVNFGIG